MSAHASQAFSTSTVPIRKIYWGWTSGGVSCTEIHLHAWKNYNGFGGHVLLCTLIDLPLIYIVVISRFWVSCLCGWQHCGGIRDRWQCLDQTGRDLGMTAGWHWTRWWHRWKLRQFSHHGAPVARLSSSLHRLQKRRYLVLGIETWRLSLNMPTETQQVIQSFFKFQRLCWSRH